LPELKQVALYEGMESFERFEERKRHRKGRQVLEVEGGIVRCLDQVAEDLSVDVTSIFIERKLDFIQFCSK
jgi:hypothetical protein